MGEYVKDESVQRHTYGYDHPFFLDARGTDSVACSLYSALSGIKMQVRTTYPCLVVFGDNFEGYMSRVIGEVEQRFAVGTREIPYRELVFALVYAIKAPDRDGASREVTKLAAGGYGAGYHGLTIGRTAGRIENARFEIDGRLTLPASA